MARVTADSNDAKFSRASSKNFLLSNYQGGSALNQSEEVTASQNVK